MASRRSKKDKPQTTIRFALAQNVVALRDRKYADLPNESARNKELAKACHCWSAQINRITKGELDTGIDTVEYLAIALNTRPQDLLTPYFAAEHISPVDHPTKQPSDSLNQVDGPLQ